MKTKPVIGFTCGAFDLTHAGHYLMFMECREQCDHLVVGLQIDPSVDRPDKNKPVQSVEERMVQLSACRHIDTVLCYNDEKDLIRLLKEVNPDVRFIGVDWKDKEYTGKDLPIKVIFNTRDHGYSSSSLRKRIVEAEKGE